MSRSGAGEKAKDIDYFSRIPADSRPGSVSEDEDDELTDAPRYVPRAHPTRLIVPVDLAEWLRLWLRLPLCDDTRIAPVRVDVEAFADWCLAGVGVCHVADDAPEPWTPVIREARSAAEGFVLRLTIRRHSGNITHAAESGKTSRRALREGLKKHGLYSEPGADTQPESDHPVLTWETVSVLDRLASTTHDPEKAAWEQAANAGIHRLREAGRQASKTLAIDIIEKLSCGMTDIAVATVIPGPVIVSLSEGRVQINLGGEITNAGPLGSRKALSILIRALIQFGGPVEPVVYRAGLDGLPTGEEGEG